MLYGLDFPVAVEQEQLAAVRSALLAHSHVTHDPLIVFEEFDKLSCAARSASP